MFLQANSSLKMRIAFIRLRKRKVGMILVMMMIMWFIHTFHLQLPNASASTS